MTIKINYSKTPEQNFIALLKESPEYAAEDIASCTVEVTGTSQTGKNTTAQVTITSSTGTVTGPFEIKYDRANVYPSNFITSPKSKYTPEFKLMNSPASNLALLNSIPLRWGEFDHDFNGVPPEGPFTITLTAKPGAYELNGTYVMNVSGFISDSGLFYFKSKDPAKFGDFANTTGSFHYEHMMTDIPLTNDRYAGQDVKNILNEPYVNVSKITFYEILLRYYTAAGGVSMIDDFNVNAVLFDIMKEEYVANYSGVYPDNLSFSDYTYKKEYVDITNSVTGAPDKVTLVTYHNAEYDIYLCAYLDGDIDPTATIKELTELDEMGTKSRSTSGITMLSSSYGLSEPSNFSGGYVAYMPFVAGSNVVATVDRWASFSSMEELHTLLDKAISRILALPVNSYTFKSVTVHVANALVPNDKLFTPGFTWDDVKSNIWNYAPGKQDFVIRIAFNDKQFIFPNDSEMNFSILAE